nr:glycosyltransferase [uncultured Brumimicrobium sp.]
MKQEQIIIFSDEPYGNNGNTHQHYTDELSKNNLVLFVNPPSGWNPFKVFKKREIGHGKNLAFTQYFNILPLGIKNKWYLQFAMWFNDWYNAIGIRKYLNNQVEQPILLYFDPFRGIYIDKFIRYKKSIFFILDPYFKMPFNSILAKRVDKVFSVNSSFTSYYTKLNKNFEVVPHGISSEELLIDTDKVNSYRKKYGQFILLIGSLNNDVDFELLIKIADSFSQNLVIIGRKVLSSAKSEENFNKLLQFENVKYIGFKDYRLLNTYIAASSLCIVPYDTSREGFGRNPIKIANYIAHKRPVINTVNLQDLEILENKILFTASNHEDFINYIQKFFGGDLEIDERFIDLYHQNVSYEVLSQKLINS